MRVIFFLFITMATFTFSTRERGKADFFIFNNLSRRIRGTNFVQRVEKIFGEVVKEVDEEGIIPLGYVPGRVVFFKTLAKLLSLNIPGRGEEYIRKLFTLEIKQELLMIKGATVPFPFERRDFLKLAYGYLKRCNEEILVQKKPLPSLEELGRRTRLTIAPGFLKDAHRVESLYLILMDYTVIDSSLLRQSLEREYMYPEYTIFHEWLHQTYPGFLNIALNEGLVAYLQSKILDPSHFVLYNHYAPELGMVREMAEIVGKDFLLKAYAEGEDYAFLKEKLSYELPEL
ncbi:MAG: hypothetical protein ACK4NT_02325, partial [Candidatus Omnitrophota bacterium]